MLSDNDSGFSARWKAIHLYGRQMFAEVLILGILSVACTAHGQTTLSTIFINEIALQVEIVDTAELRSRGLMHRETLAENTGMLFIFPKPRVLRFWMKNTPLDLDIGFFDQNLRLIKVARMKAFDAATIHTSGAPARFALEVNPNWFAQNQIRPGAKLKLTANPRKTDQ